MAHSQIHVDDILERARDAAEENKMIPLDGDTVLSPHSAQSIMYAPAAVCYAVDIVLNDDEDNEFKDIHRAFCAVRPPGHHAEYDRSMGFCIFNNIFIGAKYAQYLFGTLFDKHTAKIAIVDIDVHHGNGTQAMAWNEQNICYISMHQYDPEGRFYPGTGAANECGAFDNVLNIPLYPGSNGQDAHNQWTEKVIQKLDAFEPDLVMISAGFDAHQEDQLASLQFTAEDYQWMTQDMVRVANEHCNGKIISVLEGGYNLEALKECSTVHIKELCV